MEKKFVSTVFYLNNDEKVIDNFLDLVVPTITNNFEQYEFIFVNDGCVDGTLFHIKEYMQRINLRGVVSIIHMGFHQGIEAAMNAGRDASIGDFVYEFDSVLGDYKAELILNAYKKLISGYDIVSVSANEKERLSSRAFYKVFNKNSKIKMKLGTESFRIVSRRAINRIKSMGSHIPYRKAVYASCGLNTINLKYESTIPVQDKKKLEKESESNFSRGTNAVNYLIYFTNVMSKVSIMISTLFFLVFLGIVIYALGDYFMNSSAIEGWTSTITFISFGFLGIFIMLTIILKYLSVLLDLIFKKQKYLVSDIEKIVG